ncbi:MAG TPA: DMT family transporter [Clostridia bacterium]|nr:DMT family transporter [Clostridia bacterium]
MTLDWLAMSFALTAGIAMAVQGSLNAVLGKYVGQIEATLLVHIIGSAMAGLIVLFGFGKGNLGKLMEVPWYAYLGGIISVLIIYGVAASIPKVGVALATTAIIVGQVSTAMLIDQFGLFGLEKVPFTFMKLAGLIFLALGARLMLS